MKLNTTKYQLMMGINRFLDDGGRSYPKRLLGQIGDNDWAVIKVALEDWQSRGLLRIVKPIDDARDDEIVVEMLDYIDQKSPRPNWPPKPTA